MLSFPTGQGIINFLLVIHFFDFFSSFGIAIEYHTDSTAFLEASFDISYLAFIAAVVNKSFFLITRIVRKQEQIMKGLEGDGFIR